MTTEAVRSSPGACTDDVALRTCSPGSPGPGRRTLENVQGVLARITQRPQLTRRRDDGVQGGDRQTFGNPAGRGHDPGPDVTAVGVGLLGDQREVPLGVGVAEDQAGVGAELGFQPGEITEAAVVRHHAAVHDERVGILPPSAARGRPPDVRHESRGLGLPGFADELLVAERRFGLLVEHGFARGPEEPDPAAVDVAMALRPRSESGASRSQNVAWTRAVPAVSPNNRHILRSSGHMRPA